MPGSKKEKKSDNPVLLVVKCGQVRAVFIVLGLYV